MKYHTKLKHMTCGNDHYVHVGMVLITHRYVCIDMYLHVHVHVHGVCAYPFILGVEQERVAKWSE